MQKTNFFFLADEWSDILETARKAEHYAVTEPTVSAFLSRKALEEMLSWLYDHDSNLKLPAKDQFNLNDLIREESFQRSWGKEFGRELIIVKNTGNSAAHKSVRIGSNESLASVKYLFRFCSNVVRTYSDNPYRYVPFDESLVPLDGKTISAATYEKLVKDGEQQSIQLERRAAEISEKEGELEKMKVQLARYEQLSQQNGITPAPQVLSEKETRKLYIDVLLRQSGWDIEEANVQEFPVEATNESTGNVGNLKIDYVLWGYDGKPLAVIEAKKTTEAVERGRNQAKHYADAIEKKYGQRPVIYYTNGFDTYIWDDVTYPPRKVFGFLNFDELMRLMVRRHQRLPLREQKVNQSIANRYYQERAIRRVTERFEEEKQRRALLVMATGTGKTRVSAAIVDLITKAQWAKRILFLADRNALVSQAQKNYNEYLPSLSSIDLTKSQDQGGARVIFSTYQTIINRIDNDYRNGKRYYGVGHFDLIIIDEAHRSVYDKYGAIFEYFDALYLGLTATPKNETDRDTYALFNHAQGEPTDAYEYDTAVADEYLTPVKKVPLELKFPTQGILYNDLSEAEKREWESKFYDPVTGQVLEQINSGAINHWLFNRDTVDKVLQALMEFGHKVEGNEKIGKTIVFARSHKHAEFIFERFCALYPQYGPHFARVIDNYDSKAEQSITDFKLKDKNPQIAISVDMLDTGIDVPEILNLVFFKPVYSAAKFWQMLGRGTRLCPNIFGPMDNKKDFYVFDVCGCFEFFSQNPEGVVPGRSKSLSETTFNARAELVYLLQTQGDPLPESEDFRLSQALGAMLRKQVADLDQNGFEVKLHLRQVEEFSNPDTWNSIKELQLGQISAHVAPLVSNDETNELVKRFDLMMVKLQLAIFRKQKAQEGYVERLKVMAAELLRKAGNIPTIAKSKATLTLVLQPEFWADVSMPALERVRLELRDLSPLVEPESGRGIFYTSFTDEMTAPVTVHDFGGTFGNYGSLYARLKKIIRANQHNLTIQRLHTNQSITASELNELDRMLFEQSGARTQEEFEKSLGEKPLGIFIRSILGMDSASAREAFSGFLSNAPLSSIQIEFINDLIRFLTQNGRINPEMLFEQPFTKFHTEGIAGVFPSETSKKIIEIVRDVNDRAVAG